jgi:hypothetical protein
LNKSRLGLRDSKLTLSPVHVGSVGAAVFLALYGAPHRASELRPCSSPTRSLRPLNHLALAAYSRGRRSAGARARAAGRAGRDCIRSASRHAELIIQHSASSMDAAGELA